MKKKQKDMKLWLWAGTDQRCQKNISTPRLHKLVISTATVFIFYCAYWWLTQFKTENFRCLFGESKFLSNLQTPPCSSAILQASNSNLPLECPSLSNSRSKYGDNLAATSLQNIVFGIGAAAKTWNTRQEYIKQWWRPTEMRGFVWLDEPVQNCSQFLPPCKISANTSQFTYNNEQGPRPAIRITRIVTETFRLGLPDVHWFVMGDDDTFFVVENLVKVLSKYDHNLFYYIGSRSETHLQSLRYSHNMAFGGGGFAISYPLAKALERMQDDCIERYPLYTSDEWIQSCMADIGVPLTKEAGFHQFDIRGDALGFLSAHPSTPFISMHHMDSLDPLFPNTSKMKALQHLSNAIKVESGGIFQQSICYHKKHDISISVSWGYVVQIYPGILPPWELELPTRTFSTWLKSKNVGSFTFKTRAYPKNNCEKSVRYYLKSVENGQTGHMFSNYLRDRIGANCNQMKPMVKHLHQIRVVKERLDDSWFEAPRRQCCEVSNFAKSFMEIHVRNCKEGEWTF